MRSAFSYKSYKVKLQNNPLNLFLKIIPQRYLKLKAKENFLVYNFKIKQ